MLRLVIWIFLLAAVAAVLVRSPREPYANSKYDLTVLAIVKNEDMILDEWFQHHIWQGVQHFYVIDNDSTDGTKQIIKKYVDSGLATYYFRTEKGVQQEHYNDVYRKRARGESKWIAVIDADEFMYAREKGRTVRDYLSQLDYDEVGGARLQFKMFGSSGHVKQPAKVRESFLWREKYVPSEKCCFWKVIVNTAATTELDVHYHTITKPIVKDYDKIVINHYQILSREYFEKVKMVRGDVASIPLARDWKYFDDRDFKEELDDEVLKLMPDEEFGNFYISIVCARGYEESLNILLASIPKHFRVIIIYQNEGAVDHAIEDDGTIVVRIRHNIYEYGHWVGLKHLLENNVIPADSKVLLLHSTSKFLADPTDKLREMLSEIDGANIYYIGNHGQNNMCILDRVGIETGYNVYEKQLTMDKEYAIRLEVDHRLKDSPKAWDIKQKYSVHDREDVGVRVVYSNNVERKVTYFPSLHLEKYYATSKDGINKN